MKRQSKMKERMEAMVFEKRYEGKIRQGKAFLPAGNKRVVRKMSLLFVDLAAGDQIICLKNVPIKSRWA